MSTSLAFNFTVNKADKVILIKREFSAELPLVWDAYTKSEILDQWWAPKPWKARTKIMDFGEGGQWLYAMVGPEGEEHWAIAHFQDIQIQKKFTAHDAFADADGNINEKMPQSKWEVTFTDKGHVSLVEFRISCDELAQLEGLLQMGFKEGLSMAMEGLDALLASLKK